MLGLAAMPLIAQFAIARDAWRAGWIALGAAVVIIGLLPAALLLARRPEDMGSSPTPSVRPPAPPRVPSLPSRVRRRCARPPSGC